MNVWTRPETDIMFLVSLVMGQLPQNLNPIYIRLVHVFILNTWQLLCKKLCVAVHKLTMDMQSLAPAISAAFSRICKSERCMSECTHSNTAH